jgi:hypothetical protein
MLLLGNAETIGNSMPLFSELNEKSRIYTRIDNPAQRIEVNFSTRIFPFISLVDNEPERTNKMTTNITNLQTQADPILLQNYSPAAVLLYLAGDILYVNGCTGKHLEPAAGKANCNIYVIAYEALKHQLHLAMKKAALQVEPVNISNLTVDTNTLNLTVQVITKLKALLGLTMVVLTEVVMAHKVPLRKRMETEKKSQAGQQQAHDDIQSLRKELQCSQKKIKSANEELKSMNGELTTSKEEIQSMNKELQTINTELHSKVNYLLWVNNHMDNLLNSTEIAIVFLDNRLNFRRFTNYATHLFKPIQSQSCCQPNNYVSLWKLK